MHGLVRACRAAKINEHAWLVTDHPPVMAGGHCTGIAWTQLDLRSISHHHVRPAGDNIHEVIDLAQIGPDYRLDVFRPEPAWIVGDTRDGTVAEAHGFNRRVGRRAPLIGRVEVLLLQMGHVRLLFMLERCQLEYARRCGDDRARRRAQTTRAAGRNTPQPDSPRRSRHCPSTRYS